MRGTGVTLDRVRDGRMGGKKREGEGEGAGLYGLRSTTKEKKWSLNSIQWRKRMKPQGKKRKTRKEKNIRPKTL